jgi:hypothetical protein
MRGGGTDSRPICAVASTLLPLSQAVPTRKACHTLLISLSLSLYQCLSPELYRHAKLSYTPHLYYLASGQVVTS